MFKNLPTDLITHILYFLKWTDYLFICKNLRISINYRFVNTLSLIEVCKQKKEYAEIFKRICNSRKMIKITQRVFNTCCIRGHNEIVKEIIGMLHSGKINRESQKKPKLTVFYNTQNKIIICGNLELIKYLYGEVKHTELINIEPFKYSGHLTHFAAINCQIEIFDYFRSIGEYVDYKILLNETTISVSISQKMRKHIMRTKMHEEEHFMVLE